MFNKRYRQFLKKYHNYNLNMIAIINSNTLLNELLCQIYLIFFTFSIIELILFIY